MRTMYCVVSCNSSAARRSRAECRSECSGRPMHISETDPTCVSMKHRVWLSVRSVNPPARQGGYQMSWNVLECLGMCWNGFTLPWMHISETDPTCVSMKHRVWLSVRSVNPPAQPDVFRIMLDVVCAICVVCLRMRAVLNVMLSVSWHRTRRWRLQWPCLCLVRRFHKSIAGRMSWNIKVLDYSSRGGLSTPDVLMITVGVVFASFGDLHAHSDVSANWH